MSTPLNACMHARTGRTHKTQVSHFLQTLQDSSSQTKRWLFEPVSSPFSLAALFACPPRHKIFGDYFLGYIFMCVCVCVCWCVLCFAEAQQEQYQGKQKKGCHSQFASCAALAIARSPHAPYTLTVLTSLHERPY